MRLWRRGATAPEEKLPLLLLALCYGLYGFFLNLLPYLGDGVSEAEEWHSFVTGWIVVPLLAAGAVLATGRAKRRWGAGAAGLYPFLLALNALFWTACFGFFFLSTSAPSLAATASDLSAAIVFAYPLVMSGGVWLARRRPRLLLASLSLSGWIYPALPLLALLGGLNFSGSPHRSVELLTLPWPSIGTGRSELLAVEHGIPVARGQSLLIARNEAVTAEVLSARDGTLREALPWAVLEEVSVARWLVAEGQKVVEGQALVELSSPRLAVVVRAQVPGVVCQLLMPPGAPAAPAARLCTIQPSPSELAVSLAIWSLAALGGLVCLAFSRLGRNRPGRKMTSLLDLLVLLAVAGLVFNPCLPLLSSHIHHYNFYLGPVDDLAHGKSLLVDINCQYGVLVIYFLALLFKTTALPISYQGLSALVSALLVVQYALVYALLRQALRSQGLAIGVLTLILGANFFSQLDLATLPSIGPLRFGLAYLVLGTAAARHAWPQRQKIWRGAALALVGLASAWSFETCFYTLAAYAGILICEHALEADSLRAFATRIGRALAQAFGAGLLVHLLIAAHILWRSGEWPHWDRYLDYIALYSVGEFGTLPIEPWTPWALCLAVSFASAAALLFKAVSAPDRSSLSGLGLVAGMTTFGIAQFTYFLGRSHPNNLYHIAIPPLFLAAHWTWQLGRTAAVPRRFAATARFSFWAAAMFLAIRCVPYVRAQWEHTALAAALTGDPGCRPVLATLRSPAPTSPLVEEALDLIARHAAGKERIPLFIGPDLTTEALMLSGKTHVFPLSHPLQDDLVEPARMRALHFDHGLRAGDLLFLAKEREGLNRLQDQIVAHLQSEFTFSPVDSTRHLLVVRLTPRPEATPP